MISIRILLFLLSLSTVSASNIRKLNSIQELADNNIGFGKVFPRHGLKLLYWLSHNLEIDQNNVMRLVEPNQHANIYPSDGVYGFHLYRNNERFLPSGAVYFTVGSLNPNSYPGSQNLPSYVTEDYNNNRRDPTSNLDRVIIQLYGYQNNANRVNRVYISEHYDGRHTYEISLQLLREIRNIPDLNDFLRQAGYDFSTRDAYNHQLLHCTWRYPRFRQYRSIPECDTSESLRLEVRPGDKANARITWSGIPDTIRRKNLFVRLFGNMDSSKPLYSFSVGEQQSGSIDTSVPLDNRLQARLMECKKCFLKCKGLINFRCLSEAYVWWGHEFDEANKKLPTEVSGYNAKLQLFVKNGKACVRLYINRDFSNWMQAFDNSWVGFYKNSDAGHSSHETWQWATKFNLQKHPEEEQHTSLTYEYESGVDIQHGFQARFFLQKPVHSILAHTVPWGEETVREIKSNVQGYDASLQLIADGCKTLARIYIKRDFTDWKDKFVSSWVGFYERSSDRYLTWQWVTSFDKNDNMFTEEYMAYDYKSSMIVNPQVEVRFFLKDDYTSQRGQAVLNKNVQLPDGCRDIEELKMQGHAETLALAGAQSLKRGTWICKYFVFFYVLLTLFT